MQLQWSTNSLVSQLHQAERGLTLESSPSAALTSPVAEAVRALGDQLDQNAVPRESFFAHLLPLAIGISNPRDLTEVALTKTVGSQRAARIGPRFVQCMTAVMKTTTESATKRHQELDVRMGPLRQQWEARGPGMLVILGRWLEADLFVETAKVLVVPPVTGGFGRAHLPYNMVRIEAVLANPHDDLPEVVRLGWLVCQLNLDLPRFQGRLTRQRLETLGALSLLPAILAAGSEVELTTADVEACRQAMSVWRLISIDESKHAEIAQALHDWWMTYLSARPPMATALAALDQMIPDVQLSGA